MDKPTMHCQSEILSDIGYESVLTDDLMLKWYRDYYSTSKHLLTLYSIANGLCAKKILEVGFGRSSFVLAKSAKENNGKLFACDMRDFSYLFNDVEKKYTNFIIGLSDKAWNSLEDESLDFAFLDYFSGEDISEEFVMNEIEKCLKKMKGNSVIAIHDVFDSRYKVGEVLKKMSRSWKFKNKISFSSITYNYGLGILTVSPKGKKNILQDEQKKKLE